MRSASTQKQVSRLGFSLLEVVAAIVIPRLGTHSNSIRVNACHVQRGNIEVQAELWFRNRGRWPSKDLSDIGTVDRYFPDGVPVCPVDDSGYTIDIATGRVVGHSHMN